MTDLPAAHTRDQVEFAFRIWVRLIDQPASSRMSCAYISVASEDLESRKSIEPRLRRGFQCLDTRGNA